VEVLAASGMTTVQIATLLIDSMIRICQWMGGALLFLALLDYGFQRWKYSQDMMMTDQELRDELKESEGDPQVVARRRQIHRQLVAQKIRKEVPKADAVIVNPTELAIAIKYDPKTMPAPVVLAKGAGVVAQLIRRIALEHGIPLVERKPLAQALYKAVDVGESIPVDQYNAVAEVLRYVYKLQGKKIPTNVG
jgi:flagellar biosynthetic protein FlhB